MWTSIRTKNKTCKKPYPCESLAIHTRSSAPVRRKSPTPLRRIRDEGRGVKVQRRWVKWRPLSTCTFGYRRPWVALLRPKRRRRSSAASFGDRAPLFRVVTALHHWWNGLEKVTEKLPPRPLLRRLRVSGATNAVEISKKRKRKPPKLTTNWLHGMYAHFCAQTE